MLSGGPQALTPSELSDFFQSVRDLAVIGLNSTNLPDNTLNRIVFFQSAELDLIQHLELTRTAYETKLENDPEFRQRAEIAVAYRMAAKVLPALPQIVEQHILSVEVHYREIDIMERISLLLGESDIVVEPDMPDTGGSAVFGVAHQYVCM